MQQPPETEHSLETPWTFWFKHPVGDRSTAYEHFLHDLGTFRTVEEFYRYYIHLVRPTSIQDHCQISCFRSGNRPMWEAFPEGGQVILRIRKKSFLSRLWEDLLFGTIGEEFGEPDVVGIALSVKSKEDSLAVWLRTMNKNVVQRTMDKFRVILNLEPSVGLDMKSNAQQLTCPTKSPSLTPAMQPMNAPVLPPLMSMGKSELAMNTALSTGCDTSPIPPPKEEPAPAAPTS